MVCRAYMDFNATAPLVAEAKDAMIAAMDALGNPSSVHRDGQTARKIINCARDQVAQLCGANPAHVTFTSGATESAVHLLTPNYKMGRSDLKVATLYTSTVEHPCMLGGGRFADENVELIDVDANGCIDLDKLEAALRAHDQDLGLPLVALQLANNETGIVQPFEQVIELARTYKAITVMDAVQHVGKLPFSIDGIGCDFAFISAHKLGGPKGVGAVISRGEILMPTPLIEGGGHEKGHRGGTENLVGIAGFGAACAKASSRIDQFDEIVQRRDEIISKMRIIATDLVIHGEGVQRIPNTVCFSLPDMKSETMQIAFDMAGVAVSSGSACSSGKVGESHVLKAMGQDAGLGAIRMSFGAQTSLQECETFLNAFEKINARRKLGAKNEEAAA